MYSLGTLKLEPGFAGLFLRPSNIPSTGLFWLGMLASVSGFQMMQFGQIVLIHELKDSPLFLGLLGLAAGIPAIILNPLGGVYADRYQKSKAVESRNVLDKIVP